MDVLLSFRFSLSRFAAVDGSRQLHTAGTPYAVAWPVSSAMTSVLSHPPASNACAQSQHACLFMSTYVGMAMVTVRAVMVRSDGSTTFACVQVLKAVQAGDLVVVLDERGQDLR